MRTTTTEASIKRCTLALILISAPTEQIDAAGARGVDTRGNCIGDKCMQWRWFDAPNRDGNTFMPREYVDGNVPGRSSDPVTGVRHDWRERAARGYCGLAGRPE